MRLTTALIALACALLAGNAAAEENARGEALFDLCSQCHRADGSGNREFLAPAIAGMDLWYVRTQLQKFRDGRRGTHFDDISGMRMRPMAMTLRSEADLEAVASYVSALPAVKPAPEVEGGDATRGQMHYAVCISCHGVNGEGSEAMNGAPLGTSDWYILDQLRKFRDGVRGANPKDPIAIMMRPMAMVLPDDQALLDVVAYISTLEADETE